MQNIKECKEAKISVRQMQSLLILWIFSVAVVGIPYVVKDIWSLLVGSVFVVIEYVLICYASRKLMNNAIMQKIFAVLAGISILIYSGILIRIMCGAVNLFLLPETPVFAIILAIVLVALYSSVLGLQTIGRTGEIMFAIVAVIAIIALIFCSVDTGKTAMDFLKNCDFVDDDLINNAFGAMFMFGTPSILLVLLPYTYGRNREMSAIKASIISVIAAVVFVLIATFKFGYADLGERIFPVLNIMDTVSLPFVFGDKKDIFMIRMWILAVFSAICIGLFVCGRAFSPGKTVAKVWLIICAAGVFAVSFVMPNVIFAFGMLDKVGKVSALVFGIIIPFICIFIKKKGSAGK
ncbi:Spore germination protein YndE [bioreactor metagenome]|uniref:Spore germination protein YndE n=1 Tax=bioreactor metagenome TaxID=1076179 RepID=A0A645D1Z5_9ZZZZ|nr:GerAB/ArcD/ProY family transporter [Candidatus Metalachnospira sp.]